MSNIKISNIAEKDLINGYLFSYKNKKLKKHGAKELLKRKNRTLVLKILDEEIKRAVDDEKILLLSLGLSFEHKHYLLEFLNYIYLKKGRSGIYKENFFQIIEGKQLSNSEQKSIIEHICKCHNFDTQFLKLLNDENKVELFNSVYEEAKENCLTTDHLSFLSRDSEFIKRKDVQEIILDNLRKKGKYIEYLDLERIEVQKFLSEKFTFFEIYKKLHHVSLPKVKSQYFAVRATINLINKDLSDDDLLQIKKLVVEKINSDEDILKNDEILYILKDLSFKDWDFAEEKLVYLYLKAQENIDYIKRRKQTKRILEKLLEIKSNYSYIELKRIIRSTDDNNVKYSYALDLIKNYPNKSSNIIEFLLEMGDDTLTNRIKNEINKKSLDFSFDDIKCDFINSEPYQIRKKSVYKTLAEFANEIKATVFYAATGYVYSSGLKLLEEVLNCVKANNGTIEIVSGSLQKCTEKGKNKKINRDTVVLLNKMIVEDDLKLYTFTENFYHGKFYYLANDRTAYAIIGSSNISKTAFKDNKELDLIFKIDLSSERNEFLEWYENFKEDCTLIKELNENDFLDVDWESELDIYTSGFSRKINNVEIDNIMKAINNSDDKYEAMKLRFDIWRKYNPTKQEKVEDISALENYVVFFFSKYDLVVFESIEYGNACYYMACEDYNFDNLLILLSEQSKKTEIKDLRWVKTKNHKQGIENLEKMINDIFKQIKLEKNSE